MDIFPKDKTKKGQILTEEDYQIAANKAFRYAIYGCFFPILEFEVFRYTDRAKKSKNPETIKKARRATNIATVVLFLIFLIPLVIVVSLCNLFVGIVVAMIISFIIYKKVRKEWSRRKMRMNELGLDSKKN